MEEEEGMKEINGETGKKFKKEKEFCWCGSMPDLSLMLRSRGSLWQPYPSVFMGHDIGQYTQR